MIVAVGIEIEIEIEIGIRIEAIGEKHDGYFDFDPDFDPERADGSAPNRP